jgi:hypothetical protein
MIKQLVVTINFIGVFFIGWFFSGTVDVSQNVPQQAKVNEKFTVEITINKSDLEGFAKFQTELPDGFYAEPGETQGATFSFKDKKVKFIWMALPADEEIKISYNVTASEKGEFTLGGKFAYIYNNERGEKDVTPKTIIITDDEILSDNTEQSPQPIENTPEEETNITNTDTPQSEDNTQENEPITAVNTNTEGENSEQENINSQNSENNSFTISNITIQQNIDKQEDNSYIISVTINKGQINGFAKYETNIPNGFTAQSIETQGSNFAFRNQKAKFLWMALPNETNFTIQFKLIPTGASSGNYTISGNFSYVENDETRTQSITPTSFTYENTEEPVAENTVQNNLPNSQTDNLNNPEPNTTQEETQRQEPEMTQTQQETTNTPQDNPAARNVKYKVQIAAGHTVIPMNYFKKKYNLTDKVTLEFHEGWRKYVIGNYTVYKEARDKRNMVWNQNKITDAFVTAYNGSTRITVQEALMITNQQWYK